MKRTSGLNPKGKTLIVTGTSRGIGRALASELAQDRVNLILNARSEALLEEVATAARRKGVNTLTVVGDRS
jgi:3-oxoacyl-[acyl-carrier protein] reductase